MERLQALTRLLVESTDLQVALSEDGADWRFEWLLTPVPESWSARRAQANREPTCVLPQLLGEPFMLAASLCECQWAEPGVAEARREEWEAAFGDLAVEIAKFYDPDFTVEFAVGLDMSPIRGFVALRLPDRSGALALAALIHGFVARGAIAGAVALNGAFDPDAPFWEFQVESGDNVYPVDVQVVGDTVLLTGGADATEQRERLASKLAALGPSKAARMSLQFRPTPAMVAKIPEKARDIVAAMNIRLRLGTRDDRHLLEARIPATLLHTLALLRARSSPTPNLDPSVGG